MRQALGIRYLAVVMLVLFLAGCTETYAYLPSVGSKRPPRGPRPNLPRPSPVRRPRRRRRPPSRICRSRSRPWRPGCNSWRPGWRNWKAGQPLPPPRRRPGQGAPGDLVALQGRLSCAGRGAGAADKTYAEGYRLYQTKKYAQARTKFSQYLKEQSKGAKAQEARYYLADSFYQEAKYPEAASEFNKMASQYPKSVLAPAALLRQALAYQNLQQTASYRSTLKKLTQAYPQSPEAKEAE